MSLPPEVTPLVNALLTGARDVLGANFAGFYIRGSLASGGFDPSTSDVDMLIVTNGPLSDAEFRALGAMHNSIPPADNRFALPYDMAYIDRATLRRFEPGQRYAKIGHGEPLHRSDHRANWVFERWTLREQGIVVSGPGLKTLIDPVTPDDLRTAAGDELAYRLRAWTDEEWPRDELRVRAAQAFEVETVCRALYTFRKGALCTKHEALAWAIESLPGRWHDLIRRAKAHRYDTTEDEAGVQPALEFLLWGVSEATSNPP